MHPPLHRPHPQCQQVIKDLDRCHAENPYAKFWGSCNEAKGEHRVSRDYNYRYRSPESCSLRVSLRNRLSFHSCMLSFGVHLRYSEPLLPRFSFFVSSPPPNISIPLTSTISCPSTSLTCASPSPSLVALDSCFRAEKEMIRKANAASGAKDRALEESWDAARRERES